MSHLLSDVQPTPLELEPGSTEERVFTDLVASQVSSMKKWALFVVLVFSERFGLGGVHPINESMHARFSLQVCRHQLCHLAVSAAPTTSRHRVDGGRARR